MQYATSNLDSVSSAEWHIIFTLIPHIHMKLTYQESKPVRIDQYLTSQFSYSRNFFHHLIERGAVLLNGKTTKKSKKLLPWNTITIESLDRFLDWGVLAEAPNVPLQIKKEEEDYMVIVKPKWMLSHPNSVRDVSKPSVVGSLYHYFQDQDLPSMGSFIRAGLVHRLDKETDGLMIIAKTEKWLAHFKDLFQRKSLAATIEAKEAVPLKKFYRATVEVTPQGHDFLSSIKEAWYPYLIDADVTPKTPHPITKRGLTKILWVNMLGEWQRAEINIEILTGRTHQIRVHLSENWLPIVGDYVYGEEAEDGVMHLSSYRLQYSYWWELYHIVC